MSRNNSNLYNKKESEAMMVNDHNDSYKNGSKYKIMLLKLRPGHFFIGARFMPVRSVLVTVT